MRDRNRLLVKLAAGIVNDGQDGGQFTEGAVEFHRFHQRLISPGAFPFRLPPDPLACSTVAASLSRTLELSDITSTVDRISDPVL